MTNGKSERLEKASGRSRRLLTLLVGLLLTTLWMASGASNAVAETRVGPQPQPVAASIGPLTSAPQTNVGADGLAQLRPVSATSVAADSGGGLIGRAKGILGDDMGAIGPGVGDLKFARKVGLPADSPQATRTIGGRNECPRLVQRRAALEAAAVGPI